MKRMKGLSPQPVPPQDLKVCGSEKEINPTDQHQNKGKLQLVTQRLRQQPTVIVRAHKK